VRIKVAESSKSSQVRRLLAVLFLGVAAAAIIAYFFVSHYGPTGRYVAKNVLLSPDVLDYLKYNDRTTQYVFHGIEFIYFDQDVKGFKRVKVDRERYEKFFQLIAGDLSIQPISQELKEDFRSPHLSSLILTVRSNVSSKELVVNKVFQEVHFLPQDSDYRVELHDENGSSNWAYFHHPHIYHQIFSLFVP
jgi:hypothetical protein